MKDIGYEIHRIMEDNHMIKKEVAEKAGISESQLGRMRQSKDVYCGTLEKICNAIGVSPAYFFDCPEGGGNNVSGGIHNSSVSGNALVSVGNRATEGEAKLLRIIQHQEKIIEHLMRMNGLDAVVNP